MPYFVILFPTKVAKIPSGALRSSIRARQGVRTRVRLGNVRGKIVSLKEKK